MFDFPPAPRSGEDVAKLDGVRKALRQPHHLRRARLPGPPARALVRDGRERRRQVDAAQAGRRRHRSRTTARCTIGASVKMGYFAQHAMELLDGERTVFEDARPTPSRRPAQGSLRIARRLLRLLRRRRREALPRALRRREGAPRAGADALRPAELPGARRADQPPRHRHQGDADRRARRTTRARMLFVSHDRHFLAALSNRVLELTPEGLHHTAAATPSTSRAPAARRRACGREAITDSLRPHPEEAAQRPSRRTRAAPTLRPMVRDASP